MSDPAGAATNEDREEDKMVMDHALEVLQSQLRELQSNYDNLMQAHSAQRAAAVDTIWRYLPQHCADFKQLPPLDPSMRETETCAGNYSFGQVLGHGKHCTIRKCARMIAITPLHTVGPSPQRPGRLAVKIFRKEDVLSASQLLKIENELYSLHLLSQTNTHRNIVEFADCLHGRNCLYIVFEACPMDLFEFMASFRTSLDYNTCAFILREIAAGLKFMSEHSMCHGDLKPENVLVDTRESRLIVKLCDFALCSHFEGSASSVSKEFCGTPGFFAPEVLAEKQYCGYYADIYSLGCIFVEMMVEPNSFSRHWLGAYSKAQTVLGCSDRSRSDNIADFVMDVKVGIEWAEGKIKKASGLFPSAECQQIFLSTIRFTPNERPSLDTLLQSEWARDVNEKMVVDKLAKKLRVRSGEMDSVVLLDAKIKYLAAKAEKAERMVAAKAALAAFSAARVNQIAAQSNAVKSSGFFAARRCSNFVISSVDIPGTRKKSYGSACDEIPGIDKVETSVSPRPSSSIVSKVKLAPMMRKKSNPLAEAIGSSMDAGLTGRIDTSQYVPTSMAVNVTGRQPFTSLNVGKSRGSVEEISPNNICNSDSSDGMSSCNSDPATDTPKSAVCNKTASGTEQRVSLQNKRRSVCFDSSVSIVRNTHTAAGRRPSKVQNATNDTSAAPTVMQRRLTFMPLKPVKK